MGVQQVGSDSLQRVLDRVFKAPEYQWVITPDPWYYVKRAWDAIKVWYAQLNLAHPTAARIIAIVLLAIVIAIFAHIIWLFVVTLGAAEQRDSSDSAAEIRRGPAWYRREAERLAGEGRYPEAMQADFVALALDLDATKVLRYHPSKTPAEYLREIRLQGESRERFREIVRSLYGYAFARWPCGPDDYARWRDLTAVELHARAA